jgi:hypothetical protein
MQSTTEKPRRPSVTHFMEGVVLGRELIEAAGAFKYHPGDASILLRDRPDREQDNFALPFVLRLIADPRLADGFSAVLSDVCTTGPELSRLQGLTITDIVVAPL